MASFDPTVRNVPVTPKVRLISDFLTDLSTVEEIPHSNQTPEPQEAPAASDIHRSPGGYSNISQATTAYSSLSAAEADDLDAEVITLQLKPLHDAADNVITNIAPMQFKASTLADALMALRQPGNKLSKLFALSEEEFIVHRKHFGGSEYIRADVIENALYKGTSPPTSPSRPRIDELIQKADLATLLVLVVGVDRDNTIAWNAIRRLDKSFPSPFISSFLEPGEDGSSGPLAVGESKLLDKTVRLGIEIRTQLTIMHLSKAAGRGTFDPNEELSIIWSDSVNSDAPNTIRGWETAGLGGQGSGLSEEHQVMVETRINEIRDFFAEDTQSVEHDDIVDLEQLSTYFPWQDFVLEAVDWIRLRNHEISRAIQARGGVDKILRTLEKAIGGTNDPESQTFERTPVKKVATPMKSALKGSTKKSPVQREYVSSIGIRFPRTDSDHRSWSETYKSNWKDIADFNRRVSGGQTATAATGSRAPAATAPELTTAIGGEDDWHPANVYEEMEDVEAGPSTAPARPNRLQQVQLQDERIKENVRRSQTARTSGQPRFIDAQNNAERVEWSQATQQRSSALPQTSQTRRGKRRAQAIEEDEEVEATQDQGFERDERVIDERRRRKAPTAARRDPIQRSPAKRVRIAQSEDADYNPSPQLDSEEEERLATATAVPPSSAIDYSAIKAMAKDFTRLKAPKVQTRTRWTQVEESYLLDAIVEHGCSWARIKDQDKEGVLGGRDQVSLKDKARNMKFDFLKSGVALPENFENVPLKTTQKEKLMELGIDDF